MLPSNHKIDAVDSHLLLRHNWYVSIEGYVVATDYSEGQRTVVLHRLIMNPPKGFEVDHINRDKLDNRRSNLRNVSHKKNCYNTKTVLRSSGVRQTTSGKWQARLSGKNLGSYLTYEEAYQVRQQAIKEYEQNSH